MYTILLVIHTFVVVFLILMILIQRSSDDGMGGLGGGGNQFMTGRATANLMTRTTAILAAAFMISSLVLAVYAGRMGNSSIIDTVPAAAQPSTTAQPKNKEPLAKENPPEEHVKKAEKPAPHKQAPSVPKAD